MIVLAAKLDEEEGDESNRRIVVNKKVRVYRIIYQNELRLFTMIKGFLVNSKEE
jgi:hypothetical protein